MKYEYLILTHFLLNEEMLKQKLDILYYLFSVTNLYSHSFQIGFIVLSYYYYSNFHIVGSLITS